MKELKLTHGGFYRHFDSRDELVAEALALALARSGEPCASDCSTAPRATAPSRSGRIYRFLSQRAHRDGRAGGCAVAALAGDAPRKSVQVQAQFREQIERNIAALSEALPPNTAADSREQALVMLSTLYGALTMARAVGDSPLSREVLRTVRQRLTDAGG